jgi:GNAT superfamily N-acetyltransferase
MEEGVVRAAEAFDAEDVFSLLVQFATSYSPDAGAFEAHFPRLLADPNAVLWVAILHGQVVGYILAFRLLTLYANGPITEIQELIVDPTHRGLGIGRRLVEAIVELAHGAGCAEVTVPTRRAMDYYARLGFVETATYWKLKCRDLSSE